MTDLGTVTRTMTSSTITHRRLVRTTPDDLWDAITRPERAARWLGALTGNLSVGGRYRLVFDPHDPDSYVDGTIRTCMPARELIVTWQAPGEKESLVRMHLTPSSQGTELELNHCDLQEPASDTGHAAGWHIHLDQLIAGLESGDWSNRWGRFDELHATYASLHPTGVSGRRD